MSPRPIMAKCKSKHMHIPHGSRSEGKRTKHSNTIRYCELQASQTLTSPQGSLGGLRRERLHCKCHTSSTVSCHYITQVTFHEEDSTHKGRPSGWAWHLWLGAASRGETRHPWVYPMYGTCISMYVLE